MSKEKKIGLDHRMEIIFNSAIAYYSQVVRGKVSKPSPTRVKACWDVIKLKYAEIKVKKGKGGIEEILEGLNEDS